MPSACPVSKNAVEKLRRDALNLKITELAKILCPSTYHDLSRNEILELAVSILTGAVSSSSSTPRATNPISRREYKKEHEQLRRNKEAAAYERMRQWITANKLPRSGPRLEKNAILDIVIAHLRSTGTPTISSSPPLVPVVPPILPTPPPTPSDVPSSSFSSSPPVPVLPIFPTPPPTSRPLLPVSSLPFSIHSIFQNLFTPSTANPSNDQDDQIDVVG